MTATAQGIAIPMADLFTSEIDRAKRLGYDTRVNVTGTHVVVRLVPKTQKSKTAAKRAAPEGITAPAIESIQQYDSPQHRVDALYAALNVSLQLASDAA